MDNPHLSLFFLYILLIFFYPLCVSPPSLSLSLSLYFTLIITSRHHQLPPPLFPSLSSSFPLGLVIDIKKKSGGRVITRIYPAIPLKNFRVNTGKFFPGNFRVITQKLPGKIFRIIPVIPYFYA